MSSLALAGAAPGATFLVDTTADDPDATPGDAICSTTGGFCTLRAAIEESNALAGADRIDFAIVGSGPHVIQPATQLPVIRDALTIDGYSQAGSTANTDPILSNAVIAIVLQGQDESLDNGLSIEAEDVVVQGLQIRDFSVGIHGILAKSLIVRGCELIENGSGVKFVSVEKIRIGGSQAADRNVISGNFFDAVSLISARDGSVLGNLIGIDKTGARKGNEVGLFLNGTTRMAIGGSSAADRNVISGNQREAIFLGGDQATKIRGNFIGTDASGTGSLGNGDDAILVVESMSTQVGGSAAGEGNRIAFNDGNGISIEGTLPSSQGTSILHNEIYRNGRLGIDLREAGDEKGLVTDNDAKDVDAGPNELQNFPTLTLFDESSSEVQGMLHSLPNESFHIDIYGNSEPDASGHGEGMSHLGCVDVTTDGQGDAAFSVPVAPESFMSATATHTATGNTSEFSDRLLRLAGTCSVTNTNASGGGSLPDCWDQANADSDPGVFKIEVNVAGDVILDASLDALRSIVIDGTTAPGYTPPTTSPDQPSDGTRPFGILGSLSFDCVTLFPGTGFRARGLRIEGCSDCVLFADSTFALQDVGLHNCETGVDVFTVGSVLSPPPIIEIGGSAPADRVDVTASTFGGIVLANRGNVVQGTRFEGNAFAVGIPDDGDNNLVRGNYFDASAAEAVRLIDTGTPPTGNRLTGNSIGGSGALGIDLDGDGVTPNDAGDGDAGSNERQNFPVLTFAWSVPTGSGSAIVSGDLDSTPREFFHVEVFASSSCNASGHGEGRLFLGTLNVRTDDSGQASFTGEFEVPISLGDQVTATATDSAGNTSEFSACEEVVAAPALPEIDVTPGTVDFGTVEVGNVGMATITVQNLGDDSLSISPVIPPLTTSFAITNDGCSNQVIPSASSCTIDLDFSPGESGRFADQVTIESDDPGEPSIDVMLIGEGSTAGGCTSPDTRTIENESISGTEEIEACSEITIGPNVEVLSGANVIFRAGEGIDIVAPFSVEASADLTLEVDPTLEP